MSGEYWRVISCGLPMIEYLAHRKYIVLSDITFRNPMFQLFFVEYTKNLTIFLFIFQGEQDIVRCFCCDLGLAEWDAKDNAWREHARHNPKCWFLKSQKGDSYIKDIQFDWKKASCIP